MDDWDMIDKFVIAVQIIMVLIIDTKLEDVYLHF